MIQNPGAQLSNFPNDVVNGVFKTHNLYNVMNSDTFDTERRQILAGINECCEHRFRNLLEGPLFQASLIFDHKNWPDLNTGNGK
jgi:hypothetical protein